MRVTLNHEGIDEILVAMAWLHRDEWWVVPSQSPNIRASKSTPYCTDRKAIMIGLIGIYGLVGPGHGAGTTSGRLRCAQTNERERKRTKVTRSQ